MTLVNIQDGLIKTPMVQQFQARPQEVARQNEQANLAANQELARQADEVVLHISQSENEGIRDEERGQQGREEEEEEQEEEKPVPPPPPDEGEPAPTVGSRRIDVLV